MLLTSSGGSKASALLGLVKNAKVCVAGGGKPCTNTTTVRGRANKQSARGARRYGWTALRRRPLPRGKPTRLPLICPPAAGIRPQAAATPSGKPATTTAAWLQQQRRRWRPAPPHARRYAARARIHTHVQKFVLHRRGDSTPACKQAALTQDAAATSPAAYATASPACRWRGGHPRLLY